jgi:anhydro-N-acetylmuramic acid kinase
MRVLGLSSGTSHDGIDCAVVDFSHDDGRIVGDIVHASAFPYPPPLRAELVAALPPQQTTLAIACRLDTFVGQAFANVGARVVASCGPVDLVCSHGQTVYHWVDAGDVRGTLQIGQAAWIAERLGVPVVSDLRVRDVAAGGQGAPLVSYLDLLVLSRMPGRPAALNLGGIANLTIRDSDDGAIAFDTGPGNALIDAAAILASGRPFDAGGTIAARGRVHEALLADLLDEPYYRRQPPKTTGKEFFHAEYLSNAVSRYAPVAPEDVVRTVTELTAVTVATQLRRLRVETVMLSGGGAHNPVLMDRLRALGAPTRVVSTEEVGLPPDAKEAVAFAFLGWLTAHGLPATVASCTGARGARILGAITPGAGPLRLPEPLPKPPTILEFRSRISGGVG